MFYCTNYICASLFSTLQCVLTTGRGKILRKTKIKYRIKPIYWSTPIINYDSYQIDNRHWKPLDVNDRSISK